MSIYDKDQIVAFLRTWEKFLHRNYTIVENISEAIGSSPELTKLQEMASSGALSVLPDEQYISLFESVLQACGFRDSMGDKPEAMRRFLQRLDFSPRFALDMNCRMGQWLIFLLKEGIIHNGLGINPFRSELFVASEVAIKEQTEVAMFYGLPNKLSSGNEVFDLVLMVDLIQFTVEWRDAIREAARVLAPGGAVFISYGYPSVRVSIDPTDVYLALCQHGIGMEILVPLPGVKETKFYLWGVKK